MKPIRKFFADANDSFRDLFRRRRVSVSDPENRLETRFIHISPAGFAMSIVATVFLIFCIVLALVAYTPVLDFLPGYRTDATKSRETLMRNLIRIDSLERKMNDMLAYNESIILVVDGKTPTMRQRARTTRCRATRASCRHPQPTPCCGGRWRATANTASATPPRHRDTPTSTP